MPLFGQIQAIGYMEGLNEDVAELYYLHHDCECLSYTVCLKVY